MLSRASFVQARRTPSAPYPRRETNPAMPTLQRLPLRDSIVTTTLCTALTILGSCSRSGGTFVIDDVRDVDRNVALSAVNAPIDARFAFAPQGGHGSTAQAAAPAPQFRWSVPPGWETLPAAGMRAASFRVADSDETECSLIVLPGGAGGVVANVDRWRKQLGLAEEGPESIADLPRLPFLGSEAVYVDLAGHYAGMGDADLADARLLGLVQESGTSTVFLKMVGPADVVERERERFEQLAASMERATRSTPPPAPSAAGGLQWDAPEGWTRGPERSMRLVTFVPDGSSSTECYATLLAGDGGGTPANVDRWRTQMGLAPLSPEEHAELETLRVLDREAVLVEIDAGQFQGMSGDVVESAALLGLICELDGQTLFVKMTGPSREVLPERERFLSFCSSLR